MSTGASFTFQDFYEPKAPKPAPEPEPQAHDQAGPASEVTAYEPAPACAYAPEPAPELEEIACEQPEAGWTGAQKAGWVLIGLLGGPLGVLVASMSNIGHAHRSTATALAAGGFVAAIALCVGAAAGLSLLGLGMAASLGAASL